MKIVFVKLFREPGVRYWYPGTEAEMDDARALDFVRNGFAVIRESELPPQAAKPREDARRKMRRSEAR